MVVTPASAFGLPGYVLLIKAYEENLASHTSMPRREGHSSIAFPGNNRCSLIGHKT